VSTANDEISAVLQRRAHPPGMDALLTGWAVVTEWMSPDGTRWLAKAFSDGTTPWTATGMFYEAMEGDWPESW